MADFGIRRGLAQSFGYDQATADLVRRQEQMRQAKIYAENQAKMLAEDYDYNNAMNAWDNAAIKTWAESKVRELGEWDRQNPDWKYDPIKRSERGLKLKDLKSGKPIMEGLQVDANEKAMRAWMQDPKNAPLLDTPEFQKTKEEYKNYLETGSTDRNTANRKLFTFYPPEKRVDIVEHLQKAAARTEYDKEDKLSRGLGTGSIKSYISPERKLQQARLQLQDGEYGRYIMQRYNDEMSNLKEGQKRLTPEEYVLDIMEPAYPTPKYQDYHYRVSEPKSDIDIGGGTKGATDDFYTELLKSAQTRPGELIDSNPTAANNLFSGNGTTLRTGDLVFIDNKGNRVPLKDYTVDKFNTTGSKTIYDPKTNTFLMSSQLKVPVDLAEDLFVKGTAVNNPSGWSKFWGAEITPGNEAYANSIQIQGDEANITVWKQLDPSNRNSASAYNYGAEQSMPKYAEEKPVLSVSKLVKDFGKENAEAFVNQNRGEYNFVK